MDFTSVPIIVICSYLVGEIYKTIFKNNKETYKIIPIITSLFGGLLGVLIYLTNRELLMGIDNIYSSIVIGIISGSSSTGTNELIKKVFKEGKKDE